MSKIFISAALVFLFINCVSIKPTSIKQGKKLFESFYIGDGGTQYFIKPFKLTNSVKNEDLIIDFTIRHINKQSDTAIINYSILSIDLIKSVESIEFLNKKKFFKTNQNKLLFNERVNTKFISRFSTKISLTELIDLFNENSWDVKIHLENKINEYKAINKTKKIIHLLRENIFVLIQ